MINLEAELQIRGLHQKLDLLQEEQIKNTGSAIYLTEGNQPKTGQASYSLSVC